MSFLFEKRRKKYSVERLRLLYEDLLRHVEVSNDGFSRRESGKNDENNFTRSKLNSLRSYVRRRGIQPTNDDGTATTTTTITTTGPEQKETQSTPPESPRLWSRKDKGDLVAAFRMLSATRSPDKEGDNFGAAAIRDDASVSALAWARSIESKVVDLISTIGEVVVNGEDGHFNVGHPMPHVRSDPVFEFFCENNVLLLLVHIAKEVRLTNSSSGGRSSSDAVSFHGVVWSPLVKAQVFRTVSQLISDVRNNPVLYYLLSHDYVNDLINCILPLQQWTHPAMEKMMPAYVDLLSNVATQLAGDPHLFPFLTTLDPVSESPSFPLFSAALETATSAHAQSNSLVYGTCLNVIVGIMQIPYPLIRSWVSNAGSEQCRLADHLCRCLLNRYQRVANLTRGPVVDGVRSNAIAGQLSALNDQLAMLNEVFWSGVRGLNVRLCESLLRLVVSVLLRHLVPVEHTHFLVVGVIDADVIPAPEAFAQVSAVFLARFFSILAYAPFQRMLAVALLHPFSTKVWIESVDVRSDQQHSSEKYVLVPALNALVEGKTTAELCPNPFRAELIKGLRGDYGDWRVVASAILLEETLKSEAMDRETLTTLEVIPKFHREGYRATSIEEALATSLGRRKFHPSPAVAVTLECLGSVAVQMIYYGAQSMMEGRGGDCGRLFAVFRGSPIWRGLNKARKHFCSHALKSQDATGVADIFLDLIEAAITNRYTVHFNGSGPTTFMNLLSRHGCAAMACDSEVLVRKFRAVSSNDVEAARFHIQMSLHFRAVCKVVGRLCSRMEMELRKNPRPSPRKAGNKVVLDLVDRADEILRTLGGLLDKPEIGSDLDLRGRMSFRFNSSSKAKEKKKTSSAAPEAGRRIRTLSEDMGVFRANSHLQLVLDPTDMFVVKPMNAQVDEHRGTVLSSISLSSVIAAAPDGEWLHVAVRHEDVGFLIKNGNMALRFESVGTCLIVKQYLDRSREVLRRDLLGKVSNLFGDCFLAEEESPNIHPDFTRDELDMPQVMAV